ncbi:MAG: hypothetical protein QG579_116 [Patescibacteria group bacterium]|nr:hypothetical protein [Patescibacteria group bacterium]
MAKNLHHNDWVLQQFKSEYLKTTHRNVIIHASIIEGTLRNISKQGSFSEAVKSLAVSGKIIPKETRIFDKIKNTRNSLIHDSFRKEFDQDKIDGLRDLLMVQIQEAYKESHFLERNLINKYKIKITL